MDQLILFAPEVLTAPPAPIVARLNKYARLESLMACPVIEAELMEIFRARPTEWLDWPAYRSLIAKHAAGFGLGYKLYSMARRGLLEDKQIFLGRGIDADRPGSSDYQGFRTEYRLAPIAPERTA